MSKFSLCIFLTLCGLITVTHAAENICCTHQPNPIVKVEKIRVDTRYRVETYSQRYSTKCGTFGWRRCTRHRTLTRSQAYTVDIYATKSYPQACAKYDCCNGYTMVGKQCYKNGELPDTVGHIGDIQDALADVGDVDLNDIIGAVHDVIEG